MDKPTWFTSWDIVRKIKKLYPKVKVGHSWTLDPMASWLLIIGLWKDTKILADLQKQPKEYIATIDLSLQTDTWDADRYKRHKKIDTFFIKPPSKKDIEKILKSLIGNPILPIPPFSAKKFKWKRLYEYARNWIEIKLTQPMKIYDIKLLDYNFPLVKIWTKVGWWTYIRSIAKYLGDKLNLGWSLTYLRRIAIWKYRL